MTVDFRVRKPTNALCAVPSVVCSSTAKCGFRTGLLHLVQRLHQVIRGQLAHELGDFRVQRVVELGLDLFHQIEHSRFLRDLWGDRLPEHVDFTTIGASDDVLVPATQVDVPDATKVVVDVGGGPLDDHTNIPRDPGALRVVRAALEGRAEPCVGIAEGLRGIVVPTLITRVEHGLGELPVVSR